MKESILFELKQNTEEYVSGEALSKTLNVSRTAIWKYIKDLKNEGYEIESSTKKGYRLLSTSDVLSETEIKAILKTKILGKNIVRLAKIDSTNNYAKQIASEGSLAGTVIIAERQTAGRGRLGRIWHSPEKKGIFMSVILKPDIPPEEVQIITIAASVAVVKAIKKTTGIEAGIKWPNDLLLDGKKVCGILAEMSSEMDRINYLVIGIGMNVYHDEEDFSDELKAIAISLKQFAKRHNDEPMNTKAYLNFCRNELIANILYELEQMYSKIENMQKEEIISEWKKYAITLGHKIRFLIKHEICEGVAKDITKDGKLLIDCIDGITREVSTGEIHISGLLGHE